MASIIPRIKAETYDDTLRMIASPDTDIGTVIQDYQGRLDKNQFLHKHISQLSARSTDEDIVYTCALIVYGLLTEEMTNYPEDTLPIVTGDTYRSFRREYMQHEEDLGSTIDESQEYLRMNNPLIFDYIEASTYDSHDSGMVRVVAYTEISLLLSQLEADNMPGVYQDLNFDF